MTLDMESVTSFSVTIFRCSEFINSIMSCPTDCSRYGWRLVSRITYSMHPSSYFILDSLHGAFSSSVASLGMSELMRIDIAWMKLSTHLSPNRSNDATPVNIKNRLGNL